MIRALDVWPFRETFSLHGGKIFVVNDVLVLCVKIFFWAQACTCRCDLLFPGLLGMSSLSDSDLLISKNLDAVMVVRPAFKLCGLLPKMVFCFASVHV